MGQCCSEINVNIGEDFINNILEDKGFVLNGYTYERILNELLNKRDNQVLPKKNLEEEFFPDLLSNMKDDKNYIYYTAIINLIISKLEENNNMYKVVLLFYPFIDHTDEAKIEDSFYSLYKYTCSVLTVKNFSDLVIQYISLCTKELSSVILDKCLDTNIKLSIEEQIKNIYTDRNIQQLVDNIILEIKKINKSSSDKTIIKKNAIAELLLKYNITTIKNIRSYFLDNNINK